MKFLNVLLWEFIQNVPVITLFVAAVWLWARGHTKKALVCMAIGAISGALLICLIEPFKTGYVEPVRVTLINVLAFGLLQIPFTAYLSAEARWSNWKTDMGLGMLAGVVLALLQGGASWHLPKLILLLHGVALLVAGGLIMIGIRQLKARSLQAALGGGIGVATAMTVAIGLIDYGYYLIP